MPRTNDFTLEFTLRQHTPLIHFQADQAGATLRATELKPKLDRFLIEYFDKRGIDYGLWSIPAQPRALDYRLSLLYSGENQEDYPKTYVKKGEEGYLSPFFADGVSIDQTDLTRVTFLSFHQELLEMIEKLFPRFLAFENFGKRQSKGFGCYHLDDTTSEAFETLLREHPYPVYRYGKNASSPKKALELINEFYKHLKSGINYPHKKIYKKSLLFEYMCDDDIGWEKRRLKEKFPQIVHGEHEPIECNRQPREYRYIRAMLGLAELHEYRPKGGNKKIKIQSEERNGNTPRYQRMRSPITFKVFDERIYLLQERTYEALLDKPFKFILEGHPEEISTPTDFDLNEFLNYVARKGLINPLDKGEQ